MLCKAFRPILYFLYKCLYGNGFGIVVSLETVNSIVLDNIAHSGGFDSFYTYIGAKESCQAGKAFQQLLFQFIFLNVFHKTTVYFDRIKKQILDQANRGDGLTSIRITIEKTHSLKRFSEEDYIKDLIDTMPQYLETWGATDIQLETIPATIAGEERTAMSLSCMIGDIPFREILFVMCEEDHIASIGVSGTKDYETTLSLPDCFYAVPQE